MASAGDDSAQRFVERHLRQRRCFQKALSNHGKPDWVDVASYAIAALTAEAGHSTPAGLAWVISLGCVDLNPHPVLAGDLDHPTKAAFGRMRGNQWRAESNRNTRCQSREVAGGLRVDRMAANVRGRETCVMPDRALPVVSRRAPGRPGLARVRSSNLPTRQPVVGGRKNAGVSAKDRGRVGLWCPGHPVPGCPPLHWGGGARLRDRRIVHHGRSASRWPTSVTPGPGWIDAVGSTGC